MRGVLALSHPVIIRGRLAQAWGRHSINDLEMWSKAGSERERRREGDIACYSCRRYVATPPC